MKNAPAKKPVASGAERPHGGTSPTEVPPTDTIPADKTQTDKGRTRVNPPSPKRNTASVTAGSTSTEAGASRSIRQNGGPNGHPLTAGDYATTTNSSPSTTAVIPVVKESLRNMLGGRDKSGSAAKPKVTFVPSGDGGSGRRASLRLTRIEPWSVTRLAFAISVAMMIVGVVAVTFFWVVLDITGVWDQINASVTSVLSDSSGFNITDYLGFGRMVGLTLVLSAINVLLSTVLATIAAHLYNRASQLLGGIEVTFSEEK
ncbi:DUF3566 domain-containing protein [Aeromicrobium sp.]|uniref:DUF3566 domain-containing protein n=1 Tax=Aeromicrobium sp. TaxID=1871063 RepID=UPI0025C6DE04|nr:DUF3566 domain-containing protein [Aeromicrobium sp.]